MESIASMLSSAKVFVPNIRLKSRSQYSQQTSSHSRKPILSAHYHKDPCCLLFSGTLIDYDFMDIG